MLYHVSCASCTIYVPYFNLISFSSTMLRTWLRFVWRQLRPITMMFLEITGNFSRSLAARTESGFFEIDGHPSGTSYTTSFIYVFICYCNCWNYEISRYVKDLDYYHKAMLERYKIESAQKKGRKRNSSGCLCFSGKSRRKGKNESKTASGRSSHTGTWRIFQETCTRLQFYFAFFQTASSCRQISCSVKYF